MGSQTLFVPFVPLVSQVWIFTRQIYNRSMEFVPFTPAVSCMAERGGNGVRVRVPRLTAQKSEATFRGISKSSRKKVFSLVPFDDEIVHYNNLRYPPAKIAEILCLGHGVDPNLLTRKSVEARLRTIKKNSLKTLAPTNDLSTLKAVDDPNAICKFFILRKILSQNFRATRCKQCRRNLV